MKVYTSWWSAAWRRALKTVLQTLAATLPAGFVVTPVMLENGGWDIVLAVCAWFMTGVLAGVASLLTNLVATLPEVEYIEKGKHE